MLKITKLPGKLASSRNNNSRSAFSRNDNSKQALEKNDGDGEFDRFGGIEHAKKSRKSKGQKLAKS